MTDQKQGRMAMAMSLFVLLIWGSMIVWAATFGDKESLVLATLFEAICFGIFMTLAVLAGDKGIQTFLASRYGVPRIEETTTTKTVQTAAETKGDIATE